MLIKKIQNISFPPPEDAPSPEKIQQLRRKLAASRTVSRTLWEEHNRNEALLQQLRALVQGAQSTTPSLSFLTDVPANTNQSLTTNTSFVLSQLPALRSLLAELRPKLAALNASRVNPQPDTAKDEIREDRRNYIEERTRAHLERQGQILTQDSTVVGGRTIDPQEVQALEKIAAIFDPA